MILEDQFMRLHRSQSGPTNIFFMLESPASCQRSQHTTAPCICKNAVACVPPLIVQNETGTLAFLKSPLHCGACADERTFDHRRAGATRNAAHGKDGSVAAPARASEQVQRAIEHAAESI